MQDQIIFQQLDNVRPKHADHFYIIGRCRDGKSVAAKVMDCHPYLFIKSTIAPIEMERALNLALLKMEISRHILKSKNKYCKNFYMATSINHASYVEVSSAIGQDIIDYNEIQNEKFLKITCVKMRYLYDLKKVLNNVEIPQVVKQLSKRTNVELKLIEASYYQKSSIVNVCQKKKVGVFDQAFTLYNNQVDPMLQYFIANDLKQFGWLQCTAYRTSEEFTTCDLEFTCYDMKQVKQDGMAPWRVLSYDIESLPRPIANRINKYEFPEPTKDPVITISGILEINEDIRQFCWILRKNGDEVKQLPAFDEPDEGGYKPEETKLFNFNNEAQLLNHFFQFCVKMDVDFITGHNISRFDNAYVLKRFEKLFHRQPLWGRLKSETSFIEEKTFSSNQKGTSKVFNLHLPGRTILDSYSIMVDQHNESSYKLDNLAAKYLGTKKVPMDYNDIYPKYQTVEGRTELAVYCVKDAFLVYKLLKKLCKLVTIGMMANVTNVSLKDILSRGQGIRTISLMLSYAKRRIPRLFIPKVEIKRKTRRKRKLVQSKDGGFEMQDIEEEFDESFKGAVVVSPTTGFYTNPVSCLDFASLYPSIMQAMNMSYETLVYRDKITKMGWKEDVDVRTIPDYEYKDGKLQTTINENNPSFIMKNKRIGLLPEILESLLSERKRVKKLMKECKPHSTMYNVHNGTQLALKVSCNSIYGFTGASRGILPCKEIASSVTKYGRGLTLKTKSIIENHSIWGRDKHGCECIYGGK